MKKTGNALLNLLIGLVYLFVLQEPVNRYFGLQSFTPFSFFVNLAILCAIIFAVSLLMAVTRILLVLITRRRSRSPSNTDR